MKSITFSLEDFSVMRETKIDRFVKAFNEAIDENIEDDELFDYINKKIE